MKTWKWYNWRWIFLTGTTYYMEKADNDALFPIVLLAELSLKLVIIPAIILV